MDKVLPGLYIGNREDVLVFGRTDKSRKAILNLARPLQYELPDGVLCAKVPLWDGKENNVRSYVDAILLLDWLRSIGKSVLVHCAEGKSRSPFIIACYLAYTFPSKWNFDSALAYLSSFREVTIHPTHLQALAEVQLCLKKLPSLQK